MSLPIGRDLLNSAHREWSATTRPLRVLTLVFEPIGVLVAAAGVFADLRGWTSSYSFSTNLLSNLSGALIGVPIGLIVLQRILASQTDSVEREKVRNFRCSSARKFWEVAISPIRSGNVDDLRDYRAYLEQVLAEANELRGLFPSWPESSEDESASIEWTTGRTSEQLVRRMIEFADTTLADVAAEYDRIFATQDFQRWTASLSAQWSHLDQNVRTRVYEADESWLRLETESRARSLIAPGALTMPFTMPGAPAEIEQAQCSLRAATVDTTPHDTWQLGYGALFGPTGLHETRFWPIDTLLAALEVSMDVRDELCANV